MLKNRNIGQSFALANLTKFAEKVTTTEGRTYYRFPCWFEQLPGNFEFVVHEDLPEDLSKFIVKSGLGGDNPKIKKPEIWNHQS